MCVTQHDNKTEFRAGLFYSFYIHLMQKVFKYNASDDRVGFFLRKSKEEPEQKKSRFFFV